MFQQIESRTLTNNEVSCKHCLAPVISSVVNEYGDQFCCQGCLNVYQILNQNGLCDYYQIRNKSDARAISLKKLNYQYLDNPEFVIEFMQIKGDRVSMEFYLEGIHCTACLWLIEKIPSMLSEVISSRLNFSTSVVKIIANKNVKFSDVANLLLELGYRPHPILHEEELKKLRKKEDHAYLIKIGIAAASTMNIMIYAVSVYAGAKFEYANYFNWVSFAFATPVVFYSSLPFYKNALDKLKLKILSIDLPISVAILLGYFSGLYNTIVAKESNYFDSICMLVFLLLSARYLLKRIQEKSFDTSKYRELFSKGSILKRNEVTKEFESTHEKYINRADVVKIQAGDFFPIDGIILEGQSFINQATLTGEPLAVKAVVGDNVYCGTINLDHDLIVQVTDIGEDTKIGKILLKVEEESRKRAMIVQMVDRISEHFVKIVFILAAVVFGYYFYSTNSSHAIEMAVAFIIVTCPCALGLATPLAFSKAISSGVKRGMIIKSDEVIEKINHIKNIFLDKTGTLTKGEFKVEALEYFIEDHQIVDDLLFSLEKKSSHPIAKAIVEYFQSRAQQIVINEYQEIQGLGICANYLGQTYKIIKSSDELNVMGNIVDLINEQNKILARVKLGDELREDAPKLINELKKLGFNIFILSGDKRANVVDIAKKLDLKEEQVFSDLSPEDKNNIIKKYSESMMIGDGANDALALTSSYVGVAVQGSVDVSLRAADVYLSEQGLAAIINLISLARGTMQTVKRNLAFSIAYNAIGASLAALGFVTPLIGAILMPLSSLTVLASTILGTKKMRSSALWR